jgi:ABC-type Fe3+/spermidine/putrescine transport system ATPase subunit
MTHWSIEGVASDLERFRLGPVDLELADGKVVAVLGPSGAGKTTLLRTIAGFLPEREGWIRRGGENITGLPPEQRHVGYVPQGLGLFPHLSVLRNVSYPLDLHGRLDAKPRARALLERLGIAHLAGRRPAQISGGEQQRVALARALAAEPELVLWDEPWQALDVEARHELGVVLDELRNDAHAPIVLVTHDPSLAFSVADEFVVLRQGRVQYSGGAAALLHRPTDAFTARFVGYENVYSRATLDAASAEEFTAWLRTRAGEEGVAFPRPVLALEETGTGRWTGEVRTVHPTPEGLDVLLRVGAQDVAARAPVPDGRPVPARGSSLRFDLDEKRLCPLGSWSTREPT